MNTKDDAKDKLDMFMKHVRYFFVSLLLLSTFSLTVLAEEVKVPKWEKFVSAKKGNVNLRKAPNVKSPLLYIHHQFRYHEFSWQSDGRNTPYTLAKETIVPVIEERNGWLLVYIETDVEAWIRKDLCSFHIPIPIDRTDMHLNNGGGSPFTRIKGTEGIFVSWYDDSGNWSRQFVHFGRKFGVGILWMDYGPDDIEFARNELGTTDFTLWFDPYKLREQRVMQFMNSHEPVDYSIAYWFNYDQYLNCYSFNTTTYKHATISQPEKLSGKIVVPSTNTDGLLIHKSANPQSPTLIFLEDEEQPFFSYNVVGKLTWDKNSFKRNLVTPIKAKAMTVIGEVGEWYRVCVYSEDETATGYVRKQDCSDATLLPIPHDLLLKAVQNEAENAVIRFSTATDKKTCVMMWGAWKGGFTTFDRLKLGHLSQDKKMLKLGGMLTYQYDSDENFVKVGSSFFLGKRLTKTDEYNTPEVDFMKMTTSDITRLRDENDTGFYQEAYVNIKDAGLYKVSLWTADRVEIEY